MTKCKLLLLVLMLCFGLPMTAQQANGFAIETDPVSTVLGARTISLLLEPSQLPHWSFFTNVVQADFPDWMDDFLNPTNKDKGFETKINIGGGFAVDYFLQAQREGLYFGLLNLFFQNEVSRAEASEKVMTHNIIPRVGYRWYPFQKSAFYVNPFVGLRYEYAWDTAVRLEGQEFSAAGTQPFATVHIGYHF